MTEIGFPKKQGLYDPSLERDACGIGFIVNIKGKQSNQIIRDALTVLKNLRHRGACGCEPNTGDGAGILIQMPHLFMQSMCEGLNITLPALGQYGVGMVFLPPEPEARAVIIEAFERVIAEEGQTCLGWRAVPTSNATLGKTAKFSEPSVRQVFIGRHASIKEEAAFERKLYIIRRRIENEVVQAELKGHEFFYIPSLSYKTIVYKGMLLSEQLEDYFLDLTDPLMSSAIALVHSRFSTNTFPSWHRAHPNRYVIHNGEINTLRGNVNWMRAREALLKSDLFGKDLKKILPIIDETGSDSSMFDNCLEFLTLAGRSLPHAVMMMIPVPWEKHESLDPKKRAFYQYHSCLMEPWDGPASVGFSDGFQVGAVLDRNGLRPSRYYVTKDDRVILASEVGVLDIPAEQILHKGRLQPGRMLLIDTVKGCIVEDDQLKNQMASEQPYEQWLKSQYVPIQDLPEAKTEKVTLSREVLVKLQHAFGYTIEDLRILLEPMAVNGVEPIGSMGDDTPLAALSERPHLLYNYFKQLFAQVTNPPIDAFREEIVTSTTTLLGSQQNLLKPSAESCRQIALSSPVLKTAEFDKLKNIKEANFKAETFPILFKVEEAESGLKKALEQLFFHAEKAIRQGANLLILSDRGVDAKHAPLPTLLAVAGLHHHLIRQGLRARVSIIADTAEVREVHHFAVLLGYGVDAIHPYLAFATIEEMAGQPNLSAIPLENLKTNYVKACVKGIIKVMSKMGISTVQSYRGAQIFEAVGINSEVIEKYFTRTPSRIEGVGLGVISEEVLKRHARAFPDRPVPQEENTLDVGGFYQWRRGGEHHMLSPIVIHKLQYATSRNDYTVFKEYAKLVDDQTRKLGNLRGLFDFEFLPKPIPLDEVEPVEVIMKRFKTGAISYGAISRESHETLAIAMNRIGGKSNTGEGGEDPDRFAPDANGDSRNSKIKQVASGRFGVTSEYLVNAEEIQIKMAQGAKPGEGGQLPGKKVYPWIAKVRLSTPGVGLISPPPHHDIYSIEDLAELIHDLKNTNPQARINVKLVSEVGVGTIAAGVAKGHADVILISGNDGGTGASPQTSIKYCGLPWELGLAETHQTLVLNNLRSRVVLEVDGQMRTGRDVVIGALLGGEEFGFSTAPLIVEGCIMMRVCHLNTCPVGVATQDPRLRKKYTGNPDHVVNYFRFVAEHVRELMAELGFRTVNEMIGRSDKLRKRMATDHWKAFGIDVANMLHRPTVPADVGLYFQLGQDHGLDKALDNQVLLELCKPAIEKKKRVKATVPIRNVNRVVGTMVGAEISKRYGSAGLPENTIELHFKGSAGQSFGAFVPKGMSLYLEGDANDYLGKGLSGGKIIVTPPKKATFTPEENIIIGNVAFYGATSGEAYIYGMAGERFCVRNSGVTAVVESVGDHGCEYMTGGRVVILGKTGRNFAAGMSGGIAYIFDEHQDFALRLNRDMVHLEKISLPQELQQLKHLIENHAQLTESAKAKAILANWAEASQKFVRVIPKDYKRVLECFDRVRERNASATEEEVAMAAFEENLKDLSRVSGN